MKIKVLSKKHNITAKDGSEKTIVRYFTYVNIHVIEDGEDVGEQTKSLEVHFTKDAGKQLLKASDKQVGSDLVFAIIDGDIGLPYVYEVTEKDDEKVYPECWVRSVKEYKEIPYTPKESTCKPILDEQESEPVEIVG